MYMQLFDSKVIIRMNLSRIDMLSLRHSVLVADKKLISIITNISDITISKVIISSGNSN